MLVSISLFVILEESVQRTFLGYFEKRILGRFFQNDKSRVHRRTHCRVDSFFQNDKKNATTLKP
jgi:hypothetical protein